MRYPPASIEVHISCGYIAVIVQLIERQTNSVYTISHKIIFLSLAADQFKTHAGPITAVLYCTEADES